MLSRQDKVLIITSEFPPQPGGIGNHAFNLAKSLNSHDFDVALVSDQRSKDNAEELTFDGRLDFKIHRIKLRGVRWIMYFNRLIKGFKLVKYHDIIIASGKFSLWIVALYSFFFNRKYVAVIHGSEVNFEHNILKRSINFALKRFDKIIAVSNYTKQLISHLKLDNVVVIPNGIDSSELDLDAAEIDLKGEPKLITVGNVTDRKGQLNVIKHLSELKKIFPDIHYHIVGLPTQADEFLGIAKQLEVHGHITFHGKVSNAKLYQLLNSSDIFIMLSSETKEGDIEGFGIAIIEANYFGLPAIGALNCGIEDAIDHDRSGKLIDYNDSKACIDAINTIMTDKESYQTHAQRWAHTHDWNTIIQHYIKEITS